MDKWTRWTAYVAVASGLSLGSARPVLAWPVNAQQCTTNIAVTVGASGTTTLGFGSMVVNPTIGLTGGVKISAIDGSRTLVAGTGAIAALAGSYSRASFHGSDVGANTPAPGAGSCDDYTTKKFSGVSISVPTSVTLASGANSMTAALTWWCASCSTSTVELTGTQAVPWNYYTDDLYVGGTLTVAGGQAVGSYTGTFTITMTWQ
jgi:hypothetical protein